MGGMLSAALRLVDEGAESKEGGTAHFRVIIGEQSVKFLVCVISYTIPLGSVEILPDLQ